ncbi:MAG: hypothetical protein FD149_392 [Rhodospirillaceae bacterium]|nr:MAG: hypothetical protein FD149_392 [Rhodospirillaceae bacterium]
MRLTLVDGELRLRAAIPPSPALLAEARAVKAELLALLFATDRAAATLARAEMACAAMERDGWDVCGHPEPGEAIVDASCLPCEPFLRLRGA